MNKNSEQPQAEHQETLAERSARLEAEAAAMNDAIKSDDPLAPTAIEEEDGLHDAAIGSDDGEDAISSEQSKAIITALQNEIDTFLSFRQNTKNQDQTYGIGIKLCEEIYKMHKEKFLEEYSK